MILSEKMFKLLGCLIVISFSMFLIYEGHDGQVVAATLVVLSALLGVKVELPKESPV